MKRPAPGKARTRKPETLARHLHWQNNTTQNWLALGDHIGEVNAGLNRTRSLLAELRRSLRDTERGIRATVVEEVIAAFQLGECTGDDHADYLRKVIGRPARDTRGKR